jgi:hypothetical protein
VTGGREEATVDWVEATRGRCDPQALDGLWAGVPESMRLSCFAESSVPPEYAGAFCHDGTWRAGVDLSPLPEPIRREVAWCVFRIIELGGKIPTPGLSMLVHRLGEVIADGGGRAPVSLLGLSVRDWCQQIQRASAGRGTQGQSLRPSPWGGRVARVAAADKTHPNRHSGKSSSNEPRSIGHPGPASDAGGWQPPDPRPPGHQGPWRSRRYQPAKTPPAFANRYRAIPAPLEVTPSAPS